MSNSFSTVPHQQICVVHREESGNNFIQINKSNYSKAYRDMSKNSSALALYIWLVGNKNNYKFALSPQAIENQLGMARSSYHGALKKLKELGYLVQREGSNILDFYEVTSQNTNRKLVEDDMIIFEEKPFSTAGKQNGKGLPHERGHEYYTMPSQKNQ